MSAARKRRLQPPRDDTAHLRRWMDEVAAATCQARSRSRVGETGLVIVCITPRFGCRKTSMLAFPRACVFDLRITQTHTHTSRRPQELMNFRSNYLVSLPRPWPNLLTFWPKSPLSIKKVSFSPPWGLFKSKESHC